MTLQRDVKECRRHSHSLSLPLISQSITHSFRLRNSRTELSPFTNRLESNMPGNKSKCKKSISFAENDEVHETFHIKDLNEQELEQQWWREKDFESFRNNCRETLKLMKRKGIMVENELSGICFQGLENYCGARKNICKTRRASAYRAVLSEQALQRDQGCCDAEFLSEVYQDTSVVSQRDACIVGMRYQDEVLVGRRKTSSELLTTLGVRRKLTLRRDSRWSTSAAVA